MFAAFFIIFKIVHFFQALSNATLWPRDLEELIDKMISQGMGGGGGQQKSEVTVTVLSSESGQNHE